MTTTPRARPVEQRERGRLVAAGVLVGVVADDRRVRDRAVDPAVDAREPAGDLVDRAVEVVDPALQRDGELDEILAAAADQHALRVAQPADADPGHPGERDACEPDSDADGGDRRRRRSRKGASRKPTAYGSEKMTGYRPSCSPCSSRPAPRLTSTFTVVCDANGTWPEIAEGDASSLARVDQLDLSASS